MRLADYSANLAMPRVQPKQPLPTYIIFSDVHANLIALQAFLQATAKYRLDHVVFLNLGDTVGYGLWPNECIAALQERKIASICGNHDAWATHNIRSINEPKSARSEYVINWTRENLTSDNLSFLRRLPFSISDTPFYNIHARMEHPFRASFIKQGYQTTWQMMKELKLHNICFVGHTHAPYLAREHILDPPKEASKMEQHFNATVCKVRTFPMHFQLRQEHNYVINPGALGLPNRLPNPVAPFVIYDPNTQQISFEAVPYDLAAVHRKIRQEVPSGTLQIDLIEAFKPDSVQVNWPRE